MGFGFSAPDAPSVPSQPVASTGFQTDINGNPIGATASQDDFNIGAGLGETEIAAPVTTLNYNPLDIGAQEAIARGNPVVGPMPGISGPPHGRGQLGKTGQAPRSSLGAGVSLVETSDMDMVSPSIPDEATAKPKPKPKPAAKKKQRIYRGTESVYRRSSGVSGGS